MSATKEKTTELIRKRKTVEDARSKAVMRLQLLEDSVKSSTQSVRNNNGTLVVVVFLTTLLLLLLFLLLSSLLLMLPLLMLSLLMLLLVSEMVNLLDWCFDTFNGMSE